MGPTTVWKGAAPERSWNSTRPSRRAKRRTSRIQAGSFADLANAHALRQKLASGGRVSIESVAVNGSEFYRVMIGPWASREDAASALSRSGAKGLVVARGR